MVSINYWDDVLQHMEQVLYFLREMIIKDETEIILDGFWVNKIQALWKDCNASKSSDSTHQILFKYFEGRLPQLHGKSWEAAEHLYVPFNLENRHWVALQISLKDWSVYVYDSDHGLYKDSVLLNLLESVTNGLPLVLKRAETLTNQVGKWGEEPFRVTRVPGLKSNKRG